MTTARQHRLRAEVLIVLGLSLGQSAVYAILNLIDRLTEAVPLAEQAANMNTSDSPKPWLDLAYQLASIAFALVPVALAIYLLADAVSPGPAPSPAPARWLGTKRIGLTLGQPVRDLVWGAALAGGIGLPGIGLYLLGRQLGLTVHISTQSLGGHWWVIPVLVLAALKNGLVEEVIVVGYLADRLTELGWRPSTWIAASALLRGTYHLYQGFGPFAGNVVMGVVFAYWYHRSGRVMPLVIAHTLIDVVAFIGPSLLPVGWLS
ncbi:MAG: CPBP family intramembrane metalloprotease [Bifidobacteriaceae bacterium]|jgi:membrane protease YdiL (CAAX protease family)|nr:CPBP family intramembrane metalloprotease [Bifidobacteriaceae bacterium]